MSRILAIAFACVALGSAISADVYVVTNNIDAITNASASLTFDRQQTARLTVHARLGPFSLPLNLATNYTVRWEWTDQRDGVMVINPTGRVVDGSAGLVSAGASLFGLDLGATYDVQMWAYQHGVRSHLLAWHLATLTQSVAAGGASVSVNVTTTANVTVAESGTGNVVTGVTAAGSSVTVHRGTVMGGGGGIQSINGSTGASHTIQGHGAIVVTNFGDTTYVGYGSLGGVIIVPPVTSSNQAIRWLSDSAQTFFVPAGVTQMYVYAWGSGGGFQGGSGGFFHGVMSTTGGMALAVTVGRGADTGNLKNAVSTNRAWPNGGLSATTNGFNAGNGGGRLQIDHGTNIVLVVGGGGGGTSSSFGGGGGGFTGGTGSGTSPGFGGTQSAGGHTNGAFLAGGDAMPAQGGSRGAGGGGDGYFGGGAAQPVGSTHGGGGGGSSYHNPIYWIFQSHSRGNLGISTGSPAVSSDNPFYETGIGIGGSTTARGGDALCVFVW